MPFNVFGFTIKRTKDVTQPENIPSVVTADQQDGAVVVGADGTGYYGYAFNPLGEIKSEHDLLRRYREVAAFPEVDEAINNIVEEAIVFDDVKFPVELNLERTKLPDSIKKKFVQEFESILHLLEFDTKAHDMFRQYYVDGKVYFHLVFDGDNYKNGIADIRYIDPRKIRKIRNVKKDKTKSGVEIQTTIEEYYLYNDKGVDDKTQSGAKLTPDSVVYVNSGLLDQNNGLVLSHLQKAIKPANQLKMIEDAVVIYRLTRAPERRIFYVDVGTLPKGKAEQYVQEIMNKFRNRLIYDSATGEVADSKRHLSMMEDFWLPRRDGCFTLDTKIDLMDGRTVELGQLIVEYKLGKTNWVYSISPDGKVVPGMISWAGVTRTNTEVIKVTLDNGGVIICTPDHKFILRNGVKIEAKDLVPGSSLMLYLPIDNPRKNEHELEVKAEVEWNKLKTERNVDSIDSVKHNHVNLDRSVVSVEFISEPHDVGTLTIDENHIYHDYHNFALSAGVFVMNSKGTEITTLPAGQSLGQMEDVEYFKNKLMRALNVPITRLIPEQGFSLGRSGEITRDELKFHKFIKRLRAKFSVLFIDVLKVQLIAKGIIKVEEWDEISKQLFIEYRKDNSFSELKDLEILNNRLEALGRIEPYVGKYYSRAFVQKSILRFTEDEIGDLNTEMEQEATEQPEQEQPDEGQGNE